MTTEYAQCPACEDEGPHECIAPDTLECGECGAEFDNPFMDDAER